jgi:hydrogenase nickel incorporation protein HypA/HybF
MHEASIALSILETVIGQCQREGYTVIENVRIRIGKATNILPDALTFAFNAAKQGTPAAEADLVIEEVPVAGRCSNCGKQTEMTDRFSLKCPACGQVSLHIQTGYEMNILDMEVH